MLITLCFLVGTACCWDYRKGKIPNFLLGIMFAAGGGYSLINGWFDGILVYLIRCFGVMLALYPVFKIGAIGAGDVKLYGICSGYLPWNTFLFFLFFSLLIATAVSLLKMIKESNAIERFCYLCEYIAEVIQTGNFRLYLENEADRKAAGICLAGPILGSLLLHLGGVY